MEEEQIPEEKPKHKNEPIVQLPRIGDRVHVDPEWSEGKKVFFTHKGRIVGVNDKGYYVNIMGIGPKQISPQALKLV